MQNKVAMERQPGKVTRESKEGSRAGAGSGRRTTDGPGSTSLRGQQAAAREKARSPAAGPRWLAAAEAKPQRHP